VAETEEQVYEHLGLPWIPPVLREDRGEVDAALKGTLPALLAEGDLRGDLHTHTDLTDGLATLEQMVETAAARGYEYYAVTDHAPEPLHAADDRRSDAGPARPAPAPAPAQSTLTDDFSESTPNTKLWNVTGDGSGYSWALQNGKLVFTVPSDAQTGGQYNMVGPGWATQCRFDGNFDERIDYQLLDWPAGSGAHVQINAWVFPTSNSSAGRMTNQFSESYNGNVNQGWDLVDTQDMQGTLRLVRTGASETAYSLSKGNWVPDPHRHCAGPGPA